MIKDMEIIIVPMVVIKTIVAMADMIILGITMGTMDMDRDMQTTAVRILNLILCKPVALNSVLKYFPILKLFVCMSFLLMTGVKLCCVVIGK